MTFITKVFTPLGALLYSFFGFVTLKLNILGRYRYNLLKDAITRLNSNLSNNGVSEFIQTISSLKKISRNRYSRALLITGYNKVIACRDIDWDLKAQLRIVLMLKGMRI